MATAPRGTTARFGRDDRPRRSAGLADAGVKALASLVSVALLLALATVTGGAIVWLRFWSAEFPAERVLVVTPKPDLVVIGASALAAFALAGVAAVLLAYILDKCGRLTGEAIVALTLLAALGMLVAVAYSGGSLWPRRVLTGVVVLAVAGGTLGRYVLMIRRREDEKRRRRGIAAIAVLVLVAAAGLAFVRWWLGVALVVAAALVALDLWVARETGTNFRWFGAAVFVSVAVFGAVFAAARTYAEPQFQAAALLRESDPVGGLAAIYVTETDDRVYLGQVETACVNGRPADRPKAGSGRLFWVPRDDVTALAVGRPKRLDAAIVDTPALLDELEPLRETRPQPPAAPEPTATAPAVPPATPQPPTTTTTAAAPGAPAPVEEPIPEQDRRLLGFVASACDKPATPPFHGTLVTGSEGFDLAMRFRPLLRFDQLERWRPIAVDALARESFPIRNRERHRACLGGSDLQAACRDVSDIAHMVATVSGDGTTAEGRAYLDISGLDAVDYCAPPRCGRRPFDCDDCDSSAIYYRVHRANGRVYVDYWWFFRFNQVEAADEAAGGCIILHKRRDYPRCFDHEGDWEGITVVSAVGEEKVEFASFAEHDRIERYAREKLELMGERPVVYVARGTHAAYPKPCPRPGARSRRCAQTTRIARQPLPEARHDGLAAWGRNDDEACRREPRCLLPFPSEVVDEAIAWDRWEGNWGNCHRVRKRCVLGTGPQSPSNQRRYQNPSCYGPKNVVECDPVVGESAPAASP